jgi:hypothetical protein
MVGTLRFAHPTFLLLCHARIARRANMSQLANSDFLK